MEKLMTTAVALFLLTENFLNSYVLLTQDYFHEKRKFCQAAVNPIESQNDLGQKGPL